MFEWLKKLVGGGAASEAVIISCFYNPQNNPYRLLAFQKWYHAIRHHPHQIIECLIGEGAKKQLPDSPHISTVRTESLLWHKESLLNKIVSELPEDFRYIFWVDADVLFQNPDWLARGVEALQTAYLVQPFEYCVHLERNQLGPDFDVELYRPLVNDLERRHKLLWRSFCANHASGLAGEASYDLHGHVGFAWGARREVLEACPLYDRALIGGADHILAHAAAGHLDHQCIAKSFTDNLGEVMAWMQRWYDAVQGRIGFVEGDLYHIWHGDITSRQYLQRIRDFTGRSKGITERDEHGLYVAPSSNQYMHQYYYQREVMHIHEHDFGDFDEGFYEDMGYGIYDITDLFGPPRHVEQQPMQSEPASLPASEAPAKSEPASLPAPEASLLVGAASAAVLIPALTDIAMPAEAPAPATPESENFS